MSQSTTNNYENEKTIIKFMEAFNILILKTIFKTLCYIIFH